ncbi:hypothetical protein CI102_7838 [Trichoderma harzianum]|nr:hypothetical protein CI102_7838 [Trichoderma harzianum]
MSSKFAILYYFVSIIAHGQSTRFASHYKIINMPCSHKQPFSCFIFSLKKRSSTFDSVFPLHTHISPPNHTHTQPNIDITKKIPTTKTQQIKEKGVIKLPKSHALYRDTSREDRGDIDTKETKK